MIATAVSSQLVSIPSTITLIIKTHFEQNSIPIALLFNTSFSIYINVLKEKILTTKNELNI